MKNYIYITLIMLGTSFSLLSQDLHWSLSNLNPTLINPAFTGGYDGAFRVGVDHRRQWNTISDATGYKTVSLFADAPIYLNSSNYWLGIGAAVYQDKAGVASLNRSSALLSLALHYKVSSKTVMTMGFQGGLSNNSVDQRQLLFADQIRLNETNLSFEESQNAGMFLESFSKSYVDVNVGVKLYHQINKMSDFSFGVSAKHINRPDNLLLSNEADSSFPITLVIHSNYKGQLTKRAYFKPDVVFQKVGPINQTVVRAAVGYQVNKKGGTDVVLGLGYRSVGSNAIIGYSQLIMKNYSVGLSFDLNHSGFSEVNGNPSSIELAIVYVANPKERKKSSNVVCPRF